MKMMNTFLYIPQHVLELNQHPRPYNHAPIRKILRINTSPPTPCQQFHPQQTLQTRNQLNQDLSPSQISPLVQSPYSSQSTSSTPASTPASPLQQSPPSTSKTEDASAVAQLPLSLASIWLHSPVNKGPQVISQVVRYTRHSILD
ncbi:hypothetical protein VC83_01805 [Pseudogymnoascus destructans]|uniref:Uncharacterized protein n=1 Tax=Pseudogymnoascus destructans TaxID=655981 RepID=A0A177AJ90_9PEZI|nr:uncharacterized protein VC83_01805 [Pseudogymnoascus destructans]OAF61562.1 hypothetical protein VC83_01805 [Pseudogymnoascus destructans]